MEGDAGFRAQSNRGFDLVVSRTHRDQRFNHLLQRLVVISTTSAVWGCKIATIVEQQADIYISYPASLPPQDWDLAPGVNTHRSRWTVHPLRWHPLKYNQGDVNQWGGLLASNGHSRALLYRGGKNSGGTGSKEKLRAKLREIPI